MSTAAALPQQQAMIQGAVRHLIQNYTPKGNKVGWLMMASILVEAWDLYSIAFVLIFIRDQFKPDPLLDSGPTSACAQSPDYAGGADVHGRPVAAADEGAQPVPLPDAIAVPLHGRPSRHGHMPPASGDSPYVSIDGKRLDPLINPRLCH